MPEAPQSALREHHRFSLIWIIPLVAGCWVLFPTLSQDSVNSWR